MRMWGLPPSKMCSRHLLGAHFELHKIMGCMRKGKSLKGYIEQGLIEPQTVVSRHKTLACEMFKRGFNHKTPMHSNRFVFNYPEGKINKTKSKQDLIERCNDCALLLNGGGIK